MNPLRIGKHRQRVTLYDIPEASQDSYGQPSLSVTAICSFWAEVTPLSGREQVVAKQQWPTATHMVRCRWLGSLIPTATSNPKALILPRMYLVVELDQSQLNILFAQNIEYRNRAWALTCEQNVGS